MVACAYNSRTGKVEVVGSLKLTGPSLAYWWAPSRWKTRAQNKTQGGWLLKNDTWGWTLASTCTRTHVQLHIQELHAKMCYLISWQNSTVLCNFSICNNTLQPRTGSEATVQKLGGSWRPSFPHWGDGIETEDSTGWLEGLQKSSMLASRGAGANFENSPLFPGS